MTDYALGLDGGGKSWDGRCEHSNRALVPLRFCMIMASCTVTGYPHSIPASCICDHVLDSCAVVWLEPPYLPHEGTYLRTRVRTSVPVTRPPNSRLYR